ncbi:cytochrome P450 [Earliella scabrosa]|nr:cytochrome P450 [Earliella scabrosa]
MLLTPSLCLSLIASLVAAVVVYRLSRRRGTIAHIRGPASPSWLFGHEFAFATQAEVGDLDFKWLRDYGPTWRIGGSLGALQHIYQSSAYNYTKRQSETFIGTIMTGPGLAAALGQDHARQKKIMNPAFSAARLRMFVPLFQRFARKLSETWKAELAGTDNNLEVVFNKWISRATLDTIGEAAFDYDYGALGEGEGSPISHAYDNIFKDMGFKPTRPAALFSATWDYVPRPILEMVRYIPANPFMRLRNLNRLFTEHGTRILRQQRASLGTGVENAKNGSKDVMSLLIKANASADPKARLSDAELMAQMFTLTLAGHETTASELTFLAGCARMRERGDTEFIVEDLDSLALTMNAIKETLRMHPIVSHLPRVATKDDVIPLEYPVTSTAGETVKEIPVRAGQVIFTDFAAYHRTSGGEDSDEWNPDRWGRPDTGKNTNVGVFSKLYVHTAGVRACIGWRFAIIEMQVFIAELFEHFQVSLPSEELAIIRAPAGILMVPVVAGKEDELSVAMPLRLSLVQQ